MNQQFPELTRSHWLYGPICIDAEFRGVTILKSLFDGICAQNSGKPCAFINSDNVRSIQAHEKLGMTTIAEFTFKNTPYVIVSI